MKLRLPELVPFRMTSELFQQRVSIGSFFFFEGLCFSSWASRIPSFKKDLNLSEAELGSILLSLPLGNMISMAVTSWLVNRFGSQRVLVFGMLSYVVFLVALSRSQTPSQLSLGLLSFGLIGSLINIAVNSQAVALEALYQQPIMASFHGFWSLAGFVGGVLGTLMLNAEVSATHHFFVILLIVSLGTWAQRDSLIQMESNVQRTQAKIRRPDRRLIQLGVVAFCAMTCEGAMFDWSGVYFQKVIHAEKGWIGAGYTAFFFTMTMGRFFGDHFQKQFSFLSVVRFSSVTMAVGFMIPVIFPTMFAGIIGFLLVGIGVSSMVPMIYGAAGKSKAVSPSAALSIVSSIGFLGFVLGPPFIGWTAEITSLRVSFFMIALMGLFISITANKLEQN